MAIAAALLAAGGPALLGAQQIADADFRPRVETPRWPRGAGPSVLVDEAHQNAHTLGGSYAPFAELLRADGYRVAPLRAAIDAEALARADVVVIINALAPENVGHWRLPTPSAFSAAEIDAIVRWVGDGGSLLLVADHMPFPGAVADLAARFGFEFMNGFAIDTMDWDPIVFRRDDGSLASHPITDGERDTERVDSVVTWWGQAFRARRDEAEPLLLFVSDDVMSLNPDSAWHFTPMTPTLPVRGWLQGAATEHGAGRVVVLGEAAMLTAQLVGPRRQRTGINAPGAPHNARFVLNLMAWLTGGR